MQVKFDLRDVIGLNDRFPDYPGLKRHSPRTIKTKYYDPVKRCTFYILGSNNTGPCNGEPSDMGFTGYPVRSYQMYKWNLTGKVGRPRKKRKYRLKGIHRLSKEAVS